MKARYTITLIGAALLAAAPLAHAATPQTGDASYHVLPVLITVNKQGRVTNMLPAVRLNSAVRRVVKTTLDKMVTGPIFEHGKPASGQIVVQLLIKGTRQADDRYRVDLSYLASQPVPYGQWHWYDQGFGHRLALASADSQGRFYAQIKRPTGPVGHANHVTRGTGPIH